MSTRITTLSASFKYHIILAGAIAATLAVAPAAHAVLYWDANSTLAGTGNWDTSTMNWRTTNTPGAPDSLWTPNDGTQDAVFGGDPGAGTAGSGLGGPNGKVTVVGTINVNSITMAAAPTPPSTAPVHYSITGGAINITNPTSSIVMQTNLGPGLARQQIIASPISGTDITVVANAVAGNVNSFLTLGGLPGTSPPAMAFTGDLIFGGTFGTGANGFNQININNPTALPTTAEVRMKRTQCQLLFTAGGPGGTTAYTATFNNNIILNDSGSGFFGQSIGAQELATVITLGGVISGDSNLTFQLGTGTGNGTIVLANQSTYTGTTTLNSNTSAVLRLAVNNAVPIGTTLTVTRGRFNMAGFNQQVSRFNSGGPNGFVTNTTGTMSTLTITGNQAGSFSGLIGAVGASLPGSNDNEALVLASTHTGTLTLSNQFGNTYNGGTTINGGSVVAANNITNFGSATGSGFVAVNNGGSLGGGGSVGGPITVASGGRLAPSGVFNNGTIVANNRIGTLSAQNALTLNSGSNLDIDLGAPTPAGGTSDRVDMPGTFGSFALTVPVAANSIGVNLADPAGGAAGNGTYTLMSFQAGQYSGTNASQFFTSASPSPNSLNGATITYQLADDTNTNQNGNPGAATRVNMVVSGGPNALRWTGATDGAWNTSTANFINLGTNSSTTFAGNDNVTFDDNGPPLNTTSVTAAPGGVQPNIVTINNSTTTYSFSGGDIKGSSVGGGGGLFLGGTGPVTIGNNYTAAGPITSNKSGAGTATFNGAITAATSVTVNGGAVTLAGANTYAGDNTVNAGSLTAMGSTATFGLGDLTVNAGSAAISAGVANAILDSATVTLLGGGTANTADIGYLSLGTGISETVAGLILGSTPMGAGTYNASTHPEYFLGAGDLIVASAVAPGDINEDGLVNILDYVVGRMGDPAGTGQPLIDWAANYTGDLSGSGSGGAQGSAVPEPTTWVMLICALAGWCCRKRRVQ